MDEATSQAAVHGACLRSGSNAPQAVEQRGCVWQSILQAPGFSGTFSAWWPCRRVVLAGAPLGIQIQQDSPAASCAVRGTKEPCASTTRKFARRETCSRRTCKTTPFSVVTTWRQPGERPGNGGGRPQADDAPPTVSGSGISAPAQCVPSAVKRVCGAVAAPAGAGTGRGAAACRWVVWRCTPWGPEGAARSAVGQETADAATFWILARLGKVSEEGAASSGPTRSKLSNRSRAQVSAGLRSKPLTGEKGGLLKTGLNP